jgi:hypothetical protein
MMQSTRRISRRAILATLGAGAAVGVLTVARAGAYSPPAQATPESRMEHPTGSDELVLRIEDAGGFVPVTFNLTQMPTFSLFGDGTIVTVGPQILIYPGPALPNLLVTRLTEDGIQAVLSAAREAGLLDGDRAYGNDMIADASTTIFTTVAEGTTTTVSAYALGLGADDGLPADEREARAKLVEFQMNLGDLASWLPASAILERDVPYEIERLQIISQPYDEAGVADPSLEQEPMSWPLTTPLASFGEPGGIATPLPNGRCGVVEGADAETLVAALEQANVLTPWESEGTLYALFPRPLLPDETGCGAGSEATPEA